jgi:hypothetical protein
MGPYDRSEYWRRRFRMGSERGRLFSPMPDICHRRAEDPNKLMLMVGNKVDQGCCPSAFNTDTGCVCLSSAGQEYDVYSWRKSGLNIC